MIRFMRTFYPAWLAVVSPFFGTAWQAGYCLRCRQRSQRRMYTVQCVTFNSTVDSPSKNTRYKNNYFDWDMSTPTANVSVLRNICAL